MGPASAEWTEMWVWQHTTRRSEAARMAILTGEHLFVTGALDRRQIADMHEAVRLGGGRIDKVLATTATAADALRLERTDIASVAWHRSTRSIEIHRRDGPVVELACAEPESTEEVGRGLQRALSPRSHPVSEPVPRSRMVRFELRSGRGRIPLIVLVAALVAAPVCFWANVWLGGAALGVAAVALLAVAAVVRDTDHTVPSYRVLVPHDHRAPAAS